MINEMKKRRKIDKEEKEEGRRMEPEFKQGLQFRN